MEISGVNNLSHLLAQQTNTVKANTANVDADCDFDGDSGVDTDKDAASVSAKVALPSNVGSRIVAMSFCEPRSCIGRLSS